MLVVMMIAGFQEWALFGGCVLRDAVIASRKYCCLSLPVKQVISNILIVVAPA